MELSLLKSSVARISDRIVAMEDRRKKASSAIKSIGGLGFKVGNLTDDNIINTVEKSELNFSVGGVDGGMVARSFHGVDLVIIRAVGVIFDYKKGKIKSNKVFAPKAPFITEVDSSDDGELITVASLYRMKEEVARAIEVAGDSPNFLLMDGPLYPHPSTRMAKGTHLFKLYSEVVGLYDKLAKTCEEHGTKLVGIVEDSRSRYFSKVLLNKIVPTLPEKHRAVFSKVPSFRDTALLYDTLTSGERTFTFKISGIHDLKYKDNVFAFYMKTAKYDRPLRVEFLSTNPKSDLSEVSSKVYSLSAFSSYGLPSAIIEADARAKLTTYYSEYIYRMLFSKSLSPLIMSLRRENRPF